MRRHRYQKKFGRNHYCLLINKEATNYNYRYVRKLTGAIREKGAYYSIFEPNSAISLFQTAQRICGFRRWRHFIPPQFQKRGKVTSLIACGGDGTFNIVARVALKADIPLGILPIGACNNIARSLHGTDGIESAIKTILSQNIRKIDSAKIADQLFFGSLGIGFIPELSNLLNNQKKPRFSFGWSQLGYKAATQVKKRKMIVKIDSFRFEVNPKIINVNLLPYTSYLPLSPTSICDDSQAEIIFDIDADSKLFSSYTRQLYKKKYIYGSDIKLFRGSNISFQPTKGILLYLDGELIEHPGNLIEIKVSEKQLKVYC
ncbi:MAG: diacylglycerol/lipid kinase family protein [Candidatus Zixiibacteriota bacterium]